MHTQSNSNDDLNQNDDLQKTPKKRRAPEVVASAIGTHVKAGVIMLFWLVVGVAALSAGIFALRVLWWAGQQATRALGS